MFHTPDTRAERNPGRINVGLIRRQRLDGSIERITLSIGEGAIFYSDERPTRDITGLADEEVARILDADTHNIEALIAIPSSERVLYVIDWPRKRAERKSVDGLISIIVAGDSNYYVVGSNSLGKIKKLIRESPNHL